MIFATRTVNPNAFASSFGAFVSAVACANPLNSLSAQYGNRVIQYVDGQAKIARQSPSNVIMAPHLKPPDGAFLRQIKQARFKEKSSSDMRMPMQPFSIRPVGLFDPIAQLDYLQGFIETSVDEARDISGVEGISIRAQAQEYIDGVEVIKRKRSAGGSVRALSSDDINLAELYLRSAALFAYLNDSGDCLKAATFYSKAAQEFFATGCFSSAAAALAQLSASTYEYLAHKDGRNSTMLLMAQNERNRAATYWRSSLVNDKPNDIFQEAQIYLGLTNALMYDFDLSNSDADWFLGITSKWHANYGSELDRQNTDIYLLYRQLKRQDDLTPDRWKQVPTVIRGALLTWMKRNWQLGELTSNAEMLAFEAEQIGRDKARISGSSLN